MCKIGAIIKESGSLNYEEFRRFDSYEEMIRWMRKTYVSWVIEFDVYQLYKDEIISNLGICDEYIYLEIYNDYRE